MARPSAQELRERIELERQRNADLIEKVMEEARRDNAGATSITLAALKAITKWWSTESARLETSSKRADITNRKEYRIAARQTEEILRSIQQHGCAGDEVPTEEPTPAPAESSEPEPESSAIGTAVAAAQEKAGHMICGMTDGEHICTRHPHAINDGQHADSEGKVFDIAPPVVEVSAEIAAYIAGEGDVPPDLSSPIPERIPEPVHPTTATFADPAPVLVDLEAVAASIPAAAQVLSGPAPEFAQSAMHASPFADPTPASPRHATAPLTFADLAREPALPPPSHRSISQLSYSDCGLKYRLQRREHVAQQPQWSLIGGKAVHAAIEEIERMAAGAAPGVEMAWTDAVATFDLAALWTTHFNRQISETITENSGWPMDSWRASNRGAEGFTWWMNEGADMLRRYVAWRTEWDKEWTIARTRTGVPVIELNFALDVDGIPVRGIIDQAWQHRENGHLMIVDVKTGKSRPDDDIQLRTYGWALLYTGIPMPGDDTWSGAYIDVRKGELTNAVPVVTPDGWAELSYRFRSMDAADRAGIHLPRPSSFCGGCSVKHACPLKAGR